MLLKLKRRFASFFTSSTIKTSIDIENVRKRLKITYKLKLFPRSTKELPMIINKSDMYTIES
jgi:hypothetical protein